MENRPLCSLCPTPAPFGSVDWQAIDRSPLGQTLRKMADIPQRPDFHGEGDVLAHTRLVTEAILREPEYAEGDEEDRLILFLGALLHDVGKCRTTKVEQGQITSPHHASTGDVMTREVLWTAGLCGEDRFRNIRESVCALVRYHSFPPFTIYDKHPESKLLSAASVGELAPKFSIRKLICLERADINGRVSHDREDAMSRIEYCREMAEELGILDTPYPFPSEYSRRAYFKGRTKLPSQELYPDAFGPVILMSGLPGTGKDTWIRSNLPDLPVISLDEVRERIGVEPGENQGPVISAAQEEARKYLRKKTPFVWNATSITRELRGKQISLFEQYGAAVRTVFLETSLTEELRRNAERSRQVPESAILRMLSKLELPQIPECQSVEWLTV